MSLFVGDSAIYDMIQEIQAGQSFEALGCEYCPYVGDCAKLEDSGGYTSQDEYGVCPEEYSVDVLMEQLIHNGVTCTTYPASEAMFVSLSQFEKSTGAKLVLDPYAGRE